MSDARGCGDDQARTAPDNAPAGPTSANDPIGRGCVNFLHWDQAPGPPRWLAGSGPHVRTGAPASTLPAAAEVLRKTLGTQPVRRAEVAAESARLKMADVVAEAREPIGEEASPGLSLRQTSTTTDRLT